MRQSDLIQWANNTTCAVDVPQYEHRRESDPAIYRENNTEDADFYVDPVKSMTRFLYYNPRPSYFGFGSYINVPYELVGAGDTHFVIGTNTPMSVDDLNVLDAIPFDHRSWAGTLFREWNQREHAIFAIDRENVVVYSFEVVKNVRALRFQIMNSMGPISTVFPTNADGSRWTIDALSLCVNCRIVEERYADLFISDNVEGDFSGIVQ